MKELKILEDKLDMQHICRRQSYLLKMFNDKR